MARHPTDLADTAAAAVHDLALLSRPAITTLDIDDLDHVTAALADLAAALPQTLDQLRRYLPGSTGNNAAARLDQAGAAAAHLAALLDAAHQALGDTAEPTEPNPGGVKIQPTEGGQFSSGVDTGHPVAQRRSCRCWERSTGRGRAGGEPSAPPPPAAPDPTPNTPHLARNAGNSAAPERRPRTPPRTPADSLGRPPIARTTRRTWRGKTGGHEGRGTIAIRLKPVLRRLRPRCAGAALPERTPGSR